MSDTLNIVAIQEASAPAVLIEEAAREVPEIIHAPATPVPGLEYTTLVAEAMPLTTTASPFIQAGNGVDATDAVFSNRSFPLFPIEERVEVLLNEAGNADPEALLTKKAKLIVKAKMMQLGYALFAGTLATKQSDAPNIQGVNAVCALTGQVVKCGGTTASKQSSAYLMRFDPDDGIHWVVGNDGQFELSEIREGLLTGANDKRADGIYRTIRGHVGLAWEVKHAAVRLANINIANDTKPLTMDWINDGIGAFPEGYTPNMLLMNNVGYQGLTTDLQGVTRNADGTPNVWIPSIPVPGGSADVYATASIPRTQAVVS